MNILSRVSARRRFPAIHPHTFRSVRSSSSSSSNIDVAALLSTPYQPISPLPSASTASTDPPITPSLLHHLLRLSALPPPHSPAHETQLLATLTAQLAFVRQIQAVDTRNVSPLCSLRDESDAGEREECARVEAEVRAALAQEDVRGTFHRRIRRREGEEQSKAAEWEVLGAAERKVGRYFVVEGGRG
nr:hypothetical protein CFP56_60229 [Quercus suber]